MAREKRIIAKTFFRTLWRIGNMSVADIAGKTVGQVLFESAVAGAKEWLQVEGNHERLSPVVASGIENFVASWEAAKAAAEAETDA